MIKPWQKLSSRPIADFHIFKLRADRKVSPRTGTEHEFLVLDSRDWVNVVALTSDQQMVMIEQYRHGSNTVELEIPGGVMDPHETSPVAAAVRELREETGFEGGNARILGRVFANPAIMSNTCYTVLIENCRCVHPVQFDQGEDLATRMVPLAEVAGMVATGKIQHSLVVAALSYFDLWQRGSITAAKQVSTPAVPVPSAPENPAPRD
jgi:8-oxo-dGTP pyrophosphatase MutT (NUDIX family)